MIYPPAIDWPRVVGELAYLLGEEMPGTVGRDLASLLQRCPGWELGGGPAGWGGARTSAAETGCCGRFKTGAQRRPLPA